MVFRASNTASCVAASMRAWLNGLCVPVAVSAIAFHSKTVSVCVLPLALASGGCRAAARRSRASYSHCRPPDGNGVAGCTCRRIPIGPMGSPSKRQGIHRFLTASRGLAAEMLQVGDELDAGLGPADAAVSAKQQRHPVDEKGHQAKREPRRPCVDFPRRGRVRYGARLRRRGGRRDLFGFLRLPRLDGPVDRAASGLTSSSAFAPSSTVSWFPAP